MVLTDKGRLRLDIWLETPKQAKNTENMMSTMWNIEAICQRKVNGRPDYPLFPTGKEARHMHTFLFFMASVNKIIDLGIDFGFNHGL